MQPGSMLSAYPSLRTAMTAGDGRHVSSGDGLRSRANAVVLDLTFKVHTVCCYKEQARAIERERLLACLNVLVAFP
jgi:hypothetical protein